MNNREVENTGITALARRHPILFGSCVATAAVLVACIGVLGIAQRHVVFSIIWMTVALGVIGYQAAFFYQRASMDSTQTERRRRAGGRGPASPEELTLPTNDVEQAVPASKVSAISAAIGPLPLAFFFWFFVVATPQNPAILAVTALPALGLTTLLHNRGDSATEGWERVYPKTTSLASQFFHPLDPRKMNHAARRSGMSHRPLLTIWYISRGLLIAAWLFGLTRVSLFGDGS